MNEPPDYSRIIERGILIFALLAMALTICLFSCRARGQEIPHYPPGGIRPPVMHFPDVSPSNTAPVIVRRAAQAPIPPLPQHPAKTVAWGTNENGEEWELRVIKPAALQMPRKSWTNAFWVMCTECEGEAIRKPVRIEKMGSKAVEDGDEHEYFIYFRCCQQEFKSRYVRRVITPIAVPVQIPQK